MEELSGYRGKALGFLRKAKARVGDVLELKTAWGDVKGTLVPRYAYGDDDHIVLKLSTGYNVGLSTASLKGARVVARGQKPKFTSLPPPRPVKKLPRVLLLGTGGTIASRVDYRTGAVHPAVSSADLYSLVPELSEMAQVEPEILFNVFSENMTPQHWSKISLRVERGVQQGVAGVVITHGTDTLGYTAAALSFALQGVPVPVVFVAAQRSSDRPSSDAPLNLVCGVSAAATGSFSGVFAAMHADESDDRVALHSGTRIRKNHTSRRDAFVSVGTSPVAVWGRGGPESVTDGLPARRSDRKFKAKSKFDPRVALLKFYPSMPPAVFRSLSGKVRGVVIEGTGLGHVSSQMVKELGRYVDSGGLACMTSQCINGRVNLNVYDTGRDLQRAGVIPLEDMLAETALVKAMWALGNSKDRDGAADLMKANLAGEITTRTFPGPLD
ncbi:MAG TPA: Glu-tRNA(Gln) amidotransferase subunit GatD [Nitrososphaerales archaeon]|nr:Glu-tRNA(Gln) amidotransferase subunit GatD [Nitrososphaerales archaeon]